MKTNVLEFAMSSPRYKQRDIAWYEVWEAVENWMQLRLKKSGYTKYPDWKEQKLYIERQIRKQLK